MQKGNGTGAWMVRAGADEGYIEQLASEEKTMQRTAGGLKAKWVPKRSHAANHYLDAEVLAFAAAEIMGVRRLHLQDGQEADGAADAKARIMTGLPGQDGAAAAGGWIGVKGGGWL